VSKLRESQTAAVPDRQSRDCEETSVESPWRHGVDARR